MKIYYQSYVNKSLSEPYIRHLTAYLNEIKGKKTDLIVGELDPADDYAHPVMEYRCGYQVIQNVYKAEQEGFDAVILGHFQDAGLMEAKAIVDIPVLGLGESSMLHACQLARNIGLVTINPRFISYHKEQIAAYGLDKRIINVAALEFEPGEFTAGLDDPVKITSTMESFKAQATSLIEQGAELIIPAGGIPMLACVLAGGVQIGEVPVMNGLSVVLKTAEMAIELKRRGEYVMSRKGRFILPPPDKIESALSFAQV